MFFKRWQGHIVWSVVESEKEAKTLSSIRILVANRQPSCRVTTTGEDQNHLARVWKQWNRDWSEMEANRFYCQKEFCGKLKTVAC